LTISTASGRITLKGVVELLTKKDVRTINAAKEVLNNVKLHKVISNGSSYIKFENIGEYDKIVVSDDRLQIQFNTEVDSNLVDSTVPCLKDKEKTVPRLSYILNNKAFIETGITKKGFYIDILCNTEETEVKDGDSLVIRANYEGIEVAENETIIIQYDRNKHFSPLYQAAITALIEGIKKAGLSPIIETGDVNGFKIKKLPKAIPLESLYKYLPTDLVFS
jgi:hypothetical protein